LGYGFAVVDGSEDLSVAVEQVGASQVSAYSGVQANPLGDPLWATTGGSLALPYVYRSYSGYTSSLRLLNTGAQAANVTLNYYDLNGFSAGQTTFNNQAALSAWTTQPTTGNGFYGSVAIQSSQPLAVLSDAYNTAIDISTQAGVGATSALSALHHAQLRRLELLLRRAQPGQRDQQRHDHLLPQRRNHGGITINRRQCHVDALPAEHRWDARRPAVGPVSSPPATAPSCWRSTRAR
jgi:hypothetical protein